MALLRSISTRPHSLSLRGDNVTLRPAVAADYAQWSRLRNESRAFLAPWEPTWPADDLTKLSFRRRLRRYHREIRAGTDYPFFVFSPNAQILLGGVTLGQVQRSVSQTGTLGYWMGERYANKGFMTAAVSAVASFAFDTLQLNRIEAACLPDNTPSMCLLEKVGFSREGYARNYLCINGRWQDHNLYGLIRSDPRR
jgi:ribosomal-protein-alanine N-acetyltransferase